MILSVLYGSLLSGQHFALEMTEFSTEGYDDFAPVLYQGSLVFCSNRKADIMTVYATDDNTGGTNLWTFPLSDSSGRKHPRIFSTSLTTPFHDGPITFHPGGALAVFSRNLRVEARKKNARDPRNRLGLFSTVLSDGTWSGIRSVPFNSSDFSNTTPCFSPDGRKLYFASDGHPGSGGKDLFYSRLEEGRWQTPVHMDPPINSEKDDFGIFTEKWGTEGYISSNR